jgi:hypothetical protein
MSAYGTKRTVKMQPNGKSECNQENFEAFEHHQQFMLDQYQSK